MKKVEPKKNENQKENKPTSEVEKMSYEEKMKFLLKKRKEQFHVTFGNKKRTNNTNSDNH